MPHDTPELLTDASTAGPEPSSAEQMRVDSIEILEVQLGDHRTHYLRAGSGSPVVLLHGGASDAFDWAETMVALSKSYSLYAPHLIGYGLSEDKSDGYYLSDFVESTLAFIHGLGLPSQVLVGHSLGGRICLEIALRHPEMVHKLVLVNTVGFSRLSPWGIVLGTAAWLIRKILRRRQPFPRFLRENGEDKDWLCLEKLSRLRVPTLIVWNRYDPYYPMGGALKAKQIIPNARLEILPGFGHAPHVQNRGYFNNLLLSFIDHD
jgi:pimeloyl-ACP methyl ester carboxylesterase